MNISVKSFYYEIRPIFQSTHTIETLSYCSYFKNHVNISERLLTDNFSINSTFLLCSIIHIYLLKFKEGGVFKPHNIPYPGSANAKEVLIPSQKAKLHTLRSVLYIIKITCN